MSPAEVGGADDASSTAPDVSFILPAHNEVTLLGSTVTNLVTAAEERELAFEIVIVENGSSDGTLRLARLLAAQLPVIRVLTLPRGDYGAALVAGYRAARAPVVFSFDVDYYDLSFMDEARKLIDDGAAIVVASKRAPGSKDRRPLTRRVLTFGFTSILRVVLALPVSDAHGMKALRRDVVDPVVEQCRTRATLYDVELIVRAGRAGLRLDELPATVVERRPPRSSVAKRTMSALWDIARLKGALMREDRAKRSGPTPQPAVSPSATSGDAGSSARSG